MFDIWRSQVQNPAGWGWLRRPGPKGKAFVNLSFLPFFNSPSPNILLVFFGLLFDQHIWLYQTSTDPETFETIPQLFHGQWVEHLSHKLTDCIAWNLWSVSPASFLLSIFDQYWVYKAIKRPLQINSTLYVCCTDHCVLCCSFCVVISSTAGRRCSTSLRGIHSTSLNPVHSIPLLLRRSCSHQPIPIAY